MCSLCNYGAVPEYPRYVCVWAQSLMTVRKEAADLNLASSPQFLGRIRISYHSSLNWSTRVQSSSGGLAGSYKQWCCWHGCLSQHIQWEAFCFISHRLIAGAPPRYRTWSHSLVKNAFLSEVQLLAVLGQRARHWAVSFSMQHRCRVFLDCRWPRSPLNERWHIDTISNERFRSCHIYSALDGTIQSAHSQPMHLAGRHEKMRLRNIFSAAVKSRRSRSVFEMKCISRPPPLLSPTICVRLSWTCHVIRQTIERHSCTMERLVGVFVLSGKRGGGGI